MTTFYFVRHAHATWMPDENRPLSVQGFKDAVLVADILQGYPVSAIYTSPYRRARQTVETLAARLALELRLERDLRERKLGEGPFEDFLQAVKAVWQDPSLTHPGGESNLEAQQRGFSVVQRLKNKHQEDHIVISTHGNLMALILQRFEPELDFEFWNSLSMPDIYMLSFGSNDQCSLSRLWV